MKKIKFNMQSGVTAYLTILLASVIRSLNMQLFILPNQFAPGGVTGISAMLQFTTGLSSGVFMLALNLPLVVLGAYFLGKKFAFRTSISVLVTSGLLLLFDLIKEKTGFELSDQLYLRNEEPMLAAFAGGVLSGIALALLLKSGSSTAGTDIIASILHKKRPDMNIGKLIFALDSVVVFVSVFVYKRGLDPVLLACILIFVSSTVCDTLLAGAKSAQKFEIITNDPKTVAHQIMSSISRGVTLIPAKGMYTHEDKSLLICIVRKRQIPIMQKIIREHPDTFCYVSSTSDVYGLGFSKGS